MAGSGSFARPQAKARSIFDEDAPGRGVLANQDYCLYGGRASHSIGSSPIGAPGGAGEGGIIRPDS